MQVIKGTRVWSLGRDGPLEEEMATHPVFLPGELHGQRSLAGYVHGAAKIRHDWAHTHIYLAALGLGCGLQDLSDPLWCMWDLLLWCVNPWMRLWDLVRWPGLEPRPHALERGVLPTGTPVHAQLLSCIWLFALLWTVAPRLLSHPNCNFLKGLFHFLPQGKRLVRNKSWSSWVDCYVFFFHIKLAASLTQVNRDLQNFYFSTGYLSTHFFFHFRIRNVKKVYKEKTGNVEVLKGKEKLSLFHWLLKKMEKVQCKKLQIIDKQNRKQYKQPTSTT